MLYSPKALPPLPHSNPRSRTTSESHSRLSIEGRAHLRQFIKYALAEERVEDAEEWVKSLEQGLDELGDSFVRGGWLTGLKSAKKALNDKLNEAGREARKLKRQNLLAEREAKDTKKGKLKDNGKSPNPKSQPDKDISTPFPNTKKEEERSRTPEESQTIALEQLRNVIANLGPPKPRSYPRHLLLTCSPAGAPLPASDMGFDLLASSSTRVCAFATNVFVLPASLAKDPANFDGKSVLYGLNEWNGESFYVIPQLIFINNFSI